MYKNFDPHKPYFYSVSLSLIIIGAAIIALSLVELLLNGMGNYEFSNVFLKFVGGLVVLALGYIHLELELFRIQPRGK